MGRTVPTFRQALDAEVESWKQFREILREDDRQLFDDMVHSSFQFRDAAGCATRPVIFEAMAVSIMLGQHKLLRELEQKLAQL